MTFKLVFLCVLLFENYYLVKTHSKQMESDTTPEEFPFNAIVQGHIMCGGVLITENYVVTLAYCVSGTTTRATVYLGFTKYPQNNRSSHMEPNTQIIQSNDITIHNDFAKIKDDQFLNNIALVKLSKPAILSNNVHPGKIISKQENHFLEEKYASVSGWFETGDRHMKAASIQIRNQDTCRYFFGNNYLRGQQICGKILTQEVYEHLGNVISLDNKIIGLQTNTLSCILRCIKNDVFLSFTPFLDWMSRKMNVPIEQFTTKSQNDCSNTQDLKKFEDSINKINETLNKEIIISSKYAYDIAILNQNIQNTITELNIIKNEQNSFAISLNEQIGSIKTEINNSRTRVDRNVVNLQEELNGVRTELTNGLTAQRSLNDSAAKFSSASKDLQLKENERIDQIEEEIIKLTNITAQNQIKENDHHLQHEQKLTDLTEKLTDIDIRELKLRDKLVENLVRIDPIIENISQAQNKIHLELEVIQEGFRIYTLKEKEALKKIQEKLEGILNTVHKNSVEGHSKFGEIEKLFGEQRNDLDKHVIQETAQNRLLWSEIKSLNMSVKKFEEFHFD